jgi:hypothetical protein
MVELSLERNSMITNTVMTPLGITVPVRYMKQLILYKNRRNVNSVGKFFLPVISKNM